jgi:hypothetical protein
MRHAARIAPGRDAIVRSSPHFAQTASSVQAVPLPRTAGLAISRLAQRSQGTSRIASSISAVARAVGGCCPERT